MERPITAVWPDGYVRTYVKEEKRGGFAGKVILLDADRLEEPRDRGQKAQRLLTAQGFNTIWQRPDHEGFLLRHFEGYDQNDPPRGRSMNALQEVWPEYHKNIAAVDLKGMLSLTHVQRAAEVIQELRALLKMIGFG